MLLLWCWKHIHLPGTFIVNRQSKSRGRVCIITYVYIIYDVPFVESLKEAYVPLMYMYMSEFV